MDYTGSMAPVPLPYHTAIAGPVTNRLPIPAVLFYGPVVAAAGQKKRGALLAPRWGLVFSDFNRW